MNTAYVDWLKLGRFTDLSLRLQQQEHEAYAKTVMPTLKGSHLRLIKSA